MKEKGSVAVGTNLSPMGKSPHSTQLCPDLATHGAHKAAKSPAPSKLQRDGRWAGKLHSYLYRMGRMRYFHTSNDFLVTFLFLVCPHLDTEDLQQLWSTFPLSLLKSGRQ